MAFKNCSTTKVLCKGLLYLAAVAFVVMCVTTMATALPPTDLLAQSMQAVKEEGGDHDRVKRAVSTTTCAKPTNLEDMFMSMNTINSTNFLRPVRDDRVSNVPGDVTGDFIDATEDRACPSSLTDNITAPLAQRSLCPYFYDIVDLPEGYYPRYLNYATCKCQDCVENAAFGCEPVLTEVRVLRPTGCSNGMQLYEELPINVTTSCTCASRMVQASALFPGVEGYVK